MREAFIIWTVRTGTCCRVSLLKAGMRRARSRRYPNGTLSGQKQILNTDEILDLAQSERIALKVAAGRLLMCGEPSARKNNSLVLP